MTTGYTAAIGEDNISFKDFVLHCACSRFYDCSELPEKFVASDYCEKKLIELNDELKRIESISVEEAEIESEKECEALNLQETKFQNDNHDLMKKYSQMLEKIIDWEPPSTDHVEFKKFMIDQIKSSIACDCEGYSKYYYENEGGAQWISNKKTEILKNIVYYTKKDKEEKERIAERNLWIEQLRNSLE